MKIESRAMRNKLEKFTLNWLSVAAVIIASSGVQAQSTQGSAPSAAEASKYSLNSSQRRVLTAEASYLFQIRAYPADTTLSARQLATSTSADTPEDLLASRLGSMLKGDYAAFMASWDTNSREEIERRNVAENKPAKFWIEQWKKNLEGKSVSFKRRADYRQFVLIEYELAGSNRMTMQLALVKEGSTWKATNRLADHPVFLNWQSEQARVQVDPRHP